MKIKTLITICVTGVVLGTASLGYGVTTVVEQISGSAGDWTYTYTLTNDESLPIYDWAVWFPTNANATSATAGSANWSTTLSTHGYFPKEFLDAGYLDHVYDSTADPFHAGTPSALVGPNGEPGFYILYADDYMGSNPGEYWDGDSWEPLPETEPDISDPIWDSFMRGSKYGYDFGWTEGAGANIQTSYGVAYGGTSQLIIESPLLITDTKSFSFNTTDYSYSINDLDNNTIYFDFEGGGTVVPEPGTLGLLLVGGLALLRRKLLV